MFITSWPYTVYCEEKKKKKDRAHIGKQALFIKGGFHLLGVLFEQRPERDKEVWKPAKWQEMYPNNKKQWSQ